MFVSASDNLMFHTWQDSDLEQHSIYASENKGQFLNVCWCHDNSYLATFQEKQKPLILSSKDRTNIHPVHSIQVMNNVSAIAFKHQTKRYLAMASSTGDLVIYDTKMRIVSTIMPKLTSPVNGIEYNSDDEQLGVLCDDCMLIFFDVHDTEYNHQFKHKDVCTSMRFNPVLSHQVAVGCVNGYVALWDTSTTSKIKHYQKHSSKVTGVAMTSCGRQFLTSGIDYKICIMDNTVGDCVFRMNLHQPVTTIDISPDDKIIAAGLKDGSIYIYDIRNHLQPMYKAKVHDSAVNKLAFENGPREAINCEFPEYEPQKSSISVNGSDYRGHLDFEITGPNRKEYPPEPAIHKGEMFDKIKKDLMKTLKIQMDDLENQLLEHCSKFQTFLNMEFDSIHETIHDKWEIFTESDGGQVMQNQSYCNENKSVKSLHSNKNK